MKLVAVIASPHESGNGATLAREALRAAHEEGVEVEEVFLPRYNIEFCNACNACLRNGACAIDDDFEAVKATLAGAQGIIVCTPTYAAAPSARLKNLTDRLGQFAYLTSFFGGKYLSVIATASRSPDGAVKQMAALAGGGIFQDAKLSGKLAVALKGGQVRDMPEALASARALGRKLARNMRRQRSYPLQNLVPRMMSKLFTRRLIAGMIAKNKDRGFQAVYAELVRKGYVQPAA